MQNDNMSATVKELLEKQARSEKLFDAMALLVFIILVIAWQIFVITKLWGWFVTPFGLPALTAAHAVGLCLLAAMFKLKIPPDSGKSTRDKFKYQLELAMAYTLILALGWLASGLMP